MMVFGAGSQWSCADLHPFGFLPPGQYRLVFHVMTPGSRALMWNLSLVKTSPEAGLVLLESLICEVRSLTEEVS